MPKFTVTLVRDATQVTSVEVEADSETGKLDFLVREALAEKAKGTLKDL